MSLIVSIVGYSNSGKTRLMGEMIPLLKARGYSVGAIKHTDHESVLDQPGKDSQILWESGAEGVALIGAGQIGFRGKIDQEQGEFLGRIRQTFFPEADIILIEGFKKAPHPKILMVTAGKEEALLQETEGVLVASVGEAPIREKLPHFKRDDPEGLVRLLEDRYLKDRKTPTIRIFLDGKAIPMKEFVQDIIRSGIMGLITTLKGFRPSRTVEIKILPDNRKRGPEGNSG